MTDVMDRASVKTYKQFIGGEAVESASGETLDIENPANGQVIAKVPASAASARVTPGMPSLRSTASSVARARICGQSTTATRTSSSTARIRALTSARRAGSVTRSTSMRCQDSACARMSCSASPVRRPRPSRWAYSTGCTIMWIESPLAFSTIVSESTRNGMSSVMTSTTVRGQVQPSRSRSGLPTRTIG